MMSNENRLFYIDNLRVAITILVIAHHVGQAYGPTGGYGPVPETARAALLGPFFTVNRSFFMSLFFLISGYFMVSAYERNGPLAFVKSRLMRLGAPFLVYCAVMVPVRVFMFGEHISRWNEVLNAGHLWYIQQLLLFSLVYALWRRLRGGRPPRSDSRLPGTLAILAFAVVLAGASAAIRLWSPIDRWLNLPGFFRVAFADVPRDLSFFVIGAAACRRDWLRRYPTSAGYAWLGAGLAAAALWYAYSLWLHGLFPAAAPVMDALYPLGESLLCCGMCIGLIVVFREQVGFSGPLARVLAANPNAAYVWHPLLIVPLRMAILGIPAQSLAKSALVTAIGVPAVYLGSLLTRRPRFMRAVL